MGGVALAVLFGLSVDAEDKIVTSAYVVTAWEWMTLLILGGSGLVGCFALYRSLQLIPPTTVAVLRTLEIVIAYVVQGIVFGEVSNPLKFRMQCKKRLLSYFSVLERHFNSFLILFTVFLCIVLFCIRQYGTMYIVLKVILYA